VLPVCGPTRAPAAAGLTRQADVPASVKPHRGVMFLLNSLTVGGSERKSVRLANALAASNRQVAIAYLSPPESLLPQIHPAVATVNLQRRGKFSIPALRRLTAQLKERDWGTLVAINLYSSLYAVLAAGPRRQDLRVAVSVNATELTSRKERLQMHLYSHVLRRADVVVFGAECQRELWRSRYRFDRSSDKSVVLYNGVDVTEFSRASIAPIARAQTEGRVMLGTVGALRVEKAQINLVRAVHELSARGADVGALIVGDGPLRPQIEREIQRLGVDQKVRLVGEAQDVRPFLASMDIFVLPSDTPETFSNAVLEAMAMSLPVVVSRGGGMDEMLHFGGGISYPPGDVKSLCDLLMPLISNTAARTQLGAQAREAAENHFSFSRTFKDFEERVLAAP
jgi:glycosyltransferase involved in cell wall biosynthesis